MVITTSVETLDGLWLYMLYVGQSFLNKEDSAQFFVKIWILINGTQLYGIGSLEIHKNSVG